MTEYFWPRVLVAGDPVTEEQADEILLRTNAWWGFKASGPEWADTVADIFRLDLTAMHFLKDESRDELLARWKMPHLKFMCNRRIACAWINGPRGWCDWSGRIGDLAGCAGPYASGADLEADWRMTAAAFPFLRLRSQMLDEDGAVIHEWRVAAGNAAAVAPGERLAAPDHVFTAMLADGDDERGVSPQRLEKAVARLDERYGVVPLATIGARGAVR